MISTDKLVIMEVGGDYDNPRPYSDLLNVCREMGLGENVVGFMTAARIRRVLTVQEAEVNGIRAVTVVTAGLTNMVMAGEPRSVSATGDNFKPGTINIVSVSSEPLNLAGMSNAIITLTEAKAAALMDLGVRATGTTTDAIAVCCPPGEGRQYAGTATDVGLAMARATRRAVLESLIRNGDGPRPKDFMTRLEEEGITVDEMWNTALELHLPHSMWKVEEMRRRFEDYLNGLRNDVNVNALIYAALLLEQRGYSGQIFGLSPGEFGADPVHLLADEMLAMALVQYLAGTRGLYEYIRYERHKPGIIGQLGPFRDDIVAALIGGIMSNIHNSLIK